jgi:uncharacterized UBP type Zn finger protein
MSKKCIYCSIALEEREVIDVCRNCGLKVWGETMFSAIVKNMESAKEAGDLYQGSVSETTPPKKYQTPQSLQNTQQLSQSTNPLLNPENSIQESTQQINIPETTNKPRDSILQETNQSNTSSLLQEALITKEKIDKQRTEDLEKPSERPSHVQPTNEPETLNPQQDVIDTLDPSQEFK